MLSEKEANFSLAGLAAGCVTLPSALTQSFPEVFARVAPVTQGALPGCTGVCGSCGATCLGSVGVIIALGIAAKIKQKKLDLKCTPGCKMNR